jgi:hypothetical protein
MPLPAQDNFNRADGGVGANWTAIRASGHTIVSNQCKGATAADHNISIWNADAFDPAHYSQALVVTQIAYSGLAVRGDVAGNCYVWLWTLGATGALYRVDAGTFTSLQTGVPAPANASVAKLTAEGSDLKMYIDGVQAGTTQTDATYATGAAGIYQYGDAGALIDDWEGGNLGAAATLYLLVAN